MGRGVLSRRARGAHTGREDALERGVRIASVVVHYPGGFVLAGRSLAESERRTAKVGTLILLAWLGMIVGLLSLTTVSEALA